MLQTLSRSDRLIIYFCRLGIAGASPIMPGTCGTLLAAGLATWLFLPLSIPLRCVLLILIFWLGSLAATRVEQVLKRKDPGEVVIDELLGMWIVLLPFDKASWQTIFIAFILFRIFDMCKFWPVRASENWLPNGYGVMLDDVLAAIQALIILCLLKYMFNF